MTAPVETLVEKPPILSKARRISKEYIEHLKLFSKNARLFLLGSFFIGLTFSFFQLLFNLYLKELNFSESFIGEVLSITALGTLVVSVPAALVVRKVSFKKVLIWATLLAGSGYFLSAIFLKPSLLLLVSFFTGIGLTFFRIVSAPFFMANSTGVERTHLFSFNFVIWILAGVIGSWGAGVLTELFTDIFKQHILGLRYTLLLGVLVGVFGILPFWFLKSSEPVANSHNKGSAFKKANLKPKIGLLFKLTFPVFMIGLGAGVIIPFLNLYFKLRFHQDAHSIGIFFSLLSISMIMGTLAGPVLAKKWGMIKTIVYTQLSSIPFMLILAYTYNLSLALVAFLFRGALMNMAQPITTNFAMEQVAQEDHALTNSFIMLAWTLSWTISAFLGGRLIEKYSFTLPLVIAAGLYFISSILYHLYFHTGTKSSTS